MPSGSEGVKTALFGVRKIFGDPRGNLADPLKFPGDPRGNPADLRQNSGNPSSGTPNAPEVLF